MNLNKFYRCNMTLQLNLNKTGAGAPLSLNLDKGSKFNISAYWDTSRDVDVHAIITNDQNKATSFQDIISTYNSVEMFNPNTGSKHVAGAKGPFAPPSKCIIHQGDARTGVAIQGPTPDEVLTVDTTALPDYAQRIYIVATLHQGNGATFGDVRDFVIQVTKDDSTSLLRASVSQDFANDCIVQLGSFVRTATGWDFDPKCIGINDPSADFNTVLGMFS